MKNYLVIIPSYNEKNNIINLIVELFNYNKDIDILIVDDSKDETADIIRKYQENHPNVFLIKRVGKGGRGTAVLDGLKFGLERNYNYFVEMDADLSHQPSELKSLLDVSGVNTLVIGSRYLKKSKILNWPLKRRIFSRLANIYANAVLQIGISDYTNGYRVYGREAVSKIDFDKIKATGFFVLSEIAYQLYKKGVEFKEVPTIFINRKEGVSSFSFKEIKESFISVIKLRFEI